MECKKCHEVKDKHEGFYRSSGRLCRNCWNKYLYDRKKDKGIKEDTIISMLIDLLETQKNIEITQIKITEKLDKKLHKTEKDLKRLKKKFKCLDI